MVKGVAESALLRDKKSTVRIGDLVRLELNSNIWQIVAISGEYSKLVDNDGAVVDTEPYRRFLVRKLFDVKGKFKPSRYAESVHQSWVYRPRISKLEEIARYFNENPRDEAEACDLSEVQPNVCGAVYCLADFKDKDIQAVLNELRAAVGYSVSFVEVKNVLSVWTNRGKAAIYRGGIDEAVKRKYPYRIFVCGYDGFFFDNSVAKYETVGIDFSAKENNYVLNIKNARKALKEVGKEINGVFNVF